MKKDLRMLLELRKGPLAGMDEDEFKMIESDVRKFGFKGLSGYAKTMVQEAMRRMGNAINKAVEEKKNQNLASLSPQEIKFHGNLQAVRLKVKFFESNAQVESMFLIHLSTFKVLKMTPRY